MHKLKLRLQEAEGRVQGGARKKARRNNDDTQVLAAAWPDTILWMRLEKCNVSLYIQCF